MKKGIGYILITVIAFTSLEPVSKLLAGAIDPLALTFMRFLIGGLVLLPFALKSIKKTEIKLEIKDFITIGLLGILCVCVSMLLLQISVNQATSPALIAIIFSSSSVFTILFAVFILKERLTPVKAISVILCVLGVVVGADFKAGINIPAVVLAVLSALSFSLYTVLTKKFMKKTTAVVQTSLAFLIGSTILFFVLLIMGKNVFGGLTLNNAWIVIYLGLVVTGLGYWTYFKGIELDGAIAGAMVFFIKPILTPIATFFINGITPDMNVFIALILVVAGSVMTFFGNTATAKQ